METTKTGLRQRITAPPELIDVLRWHVDTQLETPEQQASDLLFPQEDGSFRSESSLKKAFATVGRLIGLNKRISPRGMRRTFNDVARAAKVESLVTKSISGHLTDRMKDHYSTVIDIDAAGGLPRQRQSPRGFRCRWRGPSLPMLTQAPNGGRRAMESFAGRWGISIEGDGASEGSAEDRDARYRRQPPLLRHGLLGSPGGIALPVVVGGGTPFWRDYLIDVGAPVGKDEKDACRDHHTTHYVSSDRPDGSVVENGTKRSDHFNNQPCGNSYGSDVGPFL
jgi:hypothetical protein